MDTNYEELENSIAESLSEMSVASNVFLNVQNQEFLNKAIAEVISLYLWSNDLTPNNYKTNDEDEDIRPATKFRIHDDKPIKDAWDKGIKDLNDIKFNSNKKDDSYAHKPQIPLLDFTALNETNNKKRSSLSDLKQNEILMSNFIKSRTDDVISKEKLSINEKKDQKSASINSSLCKDQIISTTSANNKKETHNKLDDAQISKSKNVRAEIKILIKELGLLKIGNTEPNQYYVDAKIHQKHEIIERFQLMEIDLKNTLQRLLDKRLSAKRKSDIEKMSREEILSEKLDLQKELLAFEELHGRPETKLEKELMRPLYDHYRRVKRVISKLNNEPTAQSTMFQDDDFLSNEEQPLVSLPSNTKEHKKLFQRLHSLDLSELLCEKEIVLQEKNAIKDLIKKYESNFVRIHGRALEKDDRNQHKDDFEKYKVLKAKLKLIDTLIEKKRKRTENQMV